MGRKPRRRRWLQVSLRTCLLVSVLGGVVLGCAVCRLREYWPHLAGVWGPRPVEVAYPGGWKAREFHRRVIDPLTGQRCDVHEGRYVLLDQYGYTRVIGWYENDLPSGTWTYYHANGRRAMQGTCREGVRTGVWTAWYEDGRRRKIDYEIRRAGPNLRDAIAD